jgi:hypothetical protein
MSYRDSTHFNDKSPFGLHVLAWSEPKKPSRDVISFEFDEAWSEMRTEALGRPVWSYKVTNETKGSGYATEFFEGIYGEPLGVCNCPSSVPCKHIKNTLKDLLENRCPEFGERAMIEGDFMLRVRE